MYYTFKCSISSLGLPYFLTVFFSVVIDINFLFLMNSYKSSISYWIWFYCFFLDCGLSTGWGLGSAFYFGYVKKFISC